MAPTASDSDRGARPHLRCDSPVLQPFKKLELRAFFSSNVANALVAVSSPRIAMTSGRFRSSAVHAGPRRTRSARAAALAGPTPRKSLFSARYVASAPSVRGIGVSVSVRVPAPGRVHSNVSSSLEAGSAVRPGVSFSARLGPVAAARRRSGPGRLLRSVSGGR